MSNPLPVLAAIQAPTVELRNSAGDLIARVNRASAAELVERGWAKPIGKRTLKYLRLEDGAPLKLLQKGWRGGSYTTERLRADGSSGLYSPGQALGWHKNVEHKAIHE